MKHNLQNVQFILSEANKLVSISNVARIASLRATVKEAVTTGLLPQSANPTQTKDINGIRFIRMNGVIMKDTGLSQDLCDLFGICDLLFVDQQIKAAMQDATITTVVLLVDSPGGYLTGVATTANLVAQLASVKETISYTTTLNASAAFWISSQANAVITSIDGEVGSVGVYMTIADWSAAYKQAGIKIELIKNTAGKYKAIGVPSEPLTAEQRAYLQQEVDKTFADFKATVLSTRNIADESLQGQTFSGQEAMEKGFTDGIAASLDDLVNVFLN